MEFIGWRLLERAQGSGLTSLMENLTRTSANVSADPMYSKLFLFTCTFSVSRKKQPEVGRTQVSNNTLRTECDVPRYSPSWYEAVLQVSFGIQLSYPIHLPQEVPYSLGANFSNRKDFLLASDILFLRVHIWLLVDL